MRSRTLLLTVILVAGFYYFISQPASSLSRLLRPFASAAGSWSGPVTANSAPGYTADEENNIEIYKTARLATVNITSTVLRENWFFQVYPSQGTGSGFIINEQGEIITNNHVVSGIARVDRDPVAIRRSTRPSSRASTPPTTWR